MELFAGNLGNTLIKDMNPIIKFIISIMIILFSIWTNDIYGQIINLGFLLILFIIWGLINEFIKLLPLMLLFTVPLFFMSIIFGSSLQSAGVSAIRIVIMFFGFVLFCGSTCPAKLVRSLNTIRLPPYASIGILITLRFIPVLRNEMQKIKDSLDLRLRGQKRDLKVWYRGMIIPFVFRISSLSDNLSLSLYMRGFGTVKPTVYRTIGIKAVDVIFLCIIVLIMAGVKWRY